MRWLNFRTIASCVKQMIEWCLVFEAKRVSFLPCNNGQAKEDAGSRGSSLDISIFFYLEVVVRLFAAIFELQKTTKLLSVTGT